MDMTSLKFKISGMDCPDCARTIKKALASVPGLSSSQLDFIGGFLSVSGSEISIPQIQTILKDLGYSAKPIDTSESHITLIFIPELDCAEEERIVRNALKDMEGLEDLRIDLFGRQATIRHSGSPDTFIAAIRRAGLKAKFSDSENRTTLQNVPHWRIWSLILASAIIVSGSILKNSALSPTIYGPIFLIGIAIGGWKIGRKGLSAARHLRLDMNFLMSSAIIGAILIGQWSEAGAVVVLFALAQLLESYSLEKSRRAISSLIDLSPRFATRISPDGFQNVSVNQVMKGELILVRPGEMIPVDGTVNAGRSSVNQANITGESRPVEKSVGDQVYAGTFNNEGALEIETVHSPGDSTLDKIIKLVEKAQATRAPSQSFVDNFSIYYTPAVVAIAAILAVVPPLIFNGAWHDWIYRALALLVIACPCALVISTPITIVSALANSARNGVLVKGGIYLENAHKISAFAFDKTGTVTRGRLVVSDVIPLNGSDRTRLISLAASIETHSEHPIAQAIVRHAQSEGIAYGTPSEFRALPGKGAAASIDGQQYFLGNQALFSEKGLLDEALLELLGNIEDASRTAVLVGTENEIGGCISISDEVKPEASVVIRELRKEGIKHVVLLTGDNQLTGIEVGKVIGADEIYSGLLPQEKVDQIMKLRENHGEVAMVGDGVNDAPALAAASIGIAMGAIGSDSALETADIALMTDDLKKIPWLIRLSRKTHRIIEQNIVTSISIKFAFVLLASLGLATLWMAVFADMGVSLLVIFNGLRALRLNNVIHNA